MAGEGQLQLLHEQWISFGEYPLRERLIWNICSQICIGDHGYTQSGQFDQGSGHVVMNHIGNLMPILNLNRTVQ
jgi:hypothetical protein